MYGVVSAPGAELFDAAAAAAATPQHAPLLTLPDEVLQKVLRCLLGLSLRAVALSCVKLRGLARSMKLVVIPGMRLPLLHGMELKRLLPHQVASLQWMLRREARGPRRPADLDPRHVTVLATPAAPAAPAANSAPGGGGGGGAGGVPLYIDRSTNRVGVHAPEPLSSGGGGCLSDAPGLGKTVTSVALMLWTLGQRSQRTGASANKRRREVAETVWTQLTGQREGYLIKVMKRMLDLIEQAWAQTPGATDADQKLLW